MSKRTYTPDERMRTSKSSRLRAPVRSAVACDVRLASSVTALAVCKATDQLACATAFFARHTATAQQHHSPQVHLFGKSDLWKRMGMVATHGKVGALCFTGDGCLGVGRRDGVLAWLACPALTPVAQAYQYGTSVADMVHHGSALVIGWRDGAVHLYDCSASPPAHTALLRRCQGHQELCCVAVSATAIAASLAHTVDVWYGTDGVCAAPLRLDLGACARSPVTALCLHGPFLWGAVTNTGRIEVWHLDGHAHCAGSLPSGHGNAVTGIAVVSGALLTSSVSRDGARTLLELRPPFALS